MSNAATKKVPGPKNPFGVTTTLNFVKQPLDFVLKGAREYGDIFKFRMGFDNWYVLCSAEFIHEATVLQAARFHKPKIARRLWKHFLGDGILTAEEGDWKRQHQLMQPGFHKKRIDAYGEVMVDYAERMVDTWAHGGVRDMPEDMSSITLGIVAKTLFDMDVNDDITATVGDAMRTLNQTMTEHINMPLPVPKWWPSKTNKRKFNAIGNVEEILRRVIAERREEGKDRGDLLSMLVFARDEAGEGMSDKELRDQSMTLFFAGHETTAMALVWMTYLLSQHPDVVVRLRQEIHAAAGSRSLRVDDLPQLPYLEMVVKESMRILPSVWSFMKEPIEDVRMGDYVIPKGSMVFISPYVTQHDPRYFPDPEVFRPERFTRENEKKLPKGAYVPFSAGSRVCIGKAFAMMEAKLILGTLVRAVDFVLPEGHEVTFLPQLSLHPKGGLPMKILKREPLEASPTSDPLAAHA